MRNVDISTISNTILIILWVILPKLYRIWKKKNIFYVYDIPFDLMPIFILSNGWMRFGIWLIIYVVFYVGFKVNLFKEKSDIVQRETIITK